MEDQELWDLMGDLEDVGLGDSITKAYSITGFYEDGEDHLDNDILTANILNAFIEVNESDGIDLFLDKLDVPKSPHMDPLVSSWFGNNYLIIKGNFTKVRAIEERLRKEFVIEKEAELKNYKKLELSGTSGSFGATGISGISGTTGYAGTTTVVYSSPGIGGSWSTSGVIVSSSKTTAASSTAATIIQTKMIQTSLKMEMPIEDLKDPPEEETETYGHPLWEKIKSKLGF
jgi:hypothetical protein